jgi:murein DD-endopeptidase MepM/ murein hydrolase activator NlpD
MHELIGDFKDQRISLHRRRSARIFARLILAGSAFGFAVMIFMSGLPAFVSDRLRGSAADMTIAVPAEGQKSSGEEFSVSDADEMRDPLFFAGPPDKQANSNKFAIRFQSASSATARTDSVFYVADKMMGASVRLMQALPAEPQDFALMGTASVEEKISALPNLDGVLVTRGAEAAKTEGGGGWEAVAADGAVLANPPASAAPQTLGSSSLEVLAPAQRREISRDVVLKAVFDRSLQSMLAESGLSAASVEAAAGAAAGLINIRQMQAGYLLAFRTDRSAGAMAGREVIHLSLYDRRGLIGSIGQNSEGRYSKISDPWEKDGLLAYALEDEPGVSGKRFRIMDGIYSAGVRNGIEPHILTETIMQMARSYDLGQFIQRDDSFSIIYSEAPREAGRGEGHVLFASVTHAGEALSCYMLKPTPDSAFTCMTEKDTVTERLGPAGFVIPVDGSLRSRFGLRRHPILGDMRMHKGVDWAAPPGTPVRATFDGIVDFAGDSGGYGNFIRIGHANDMGSGYGHLSAFAKDIRKGASVTAGQVIGYVGSTGLSTGPHLHFEIYVNSEAVDPLGLETEVQQAVGAGEADKLVSRIIHVESGGNPNAANPLSSASGLGQFIDSTWMRMIRSYRPDIARSMSREQALQLRFDPQIASEMLHRLTAENEADLRRAGHQASAGNLYLAHFLGSMGANYVLSAPSETPLYDILDSQVISANPFLYGRDAAWVINWAARKMNRSAPAIVIAQARLPEATRIKNSRFSAYSAAIDKLLESIRKNKPGAVGAS